MLGNLNIPLSLLDYPLHRLAYFGIPEDPWPDYISRCGIVSTHIPVLIQIATAYLPPLRPQADPDEEEIPDEIDELDEDEDYAEDFYPEDLANVHAWRALGQLRAVEAAPALIRLFTSEMADYFGWIDDDLPKVFGLFGVSTLPLITKLLKEPTGHYGAIQCILEIAKQPNVDIEYVIRPLVEVLSGYRENDPGFNSSIIYTLSGLCIPSTYLLVKEVYQSGQVDYFYVGDWEDFLVAVGFLEKRITQPAEGRPILRMRNERIQK